MNSGNSIMARALGWWERYWFPPTPVVRLAVMRIIAVGFQLFWFFPGLDYQLRLVRGNTGFHEPEFIIRIVTTLVDESVFRTVGGITTLWWITWVTGLLALVGLFTRTALFVFAAGTWLLVAHGYSYGEMHHPEAIYCIFLMLLAFSPAGRCLSLDAWLFGRRSNRHAPPLNEGWGIRAVDTTAQWPLTAAMWLMAMAYLCAGLAKLKVGGLEWFNGDTLQWYLLQDGKRWGSDLGLWLATQKELCIAISIGAVAFEVGFPIVLYFRRLAPLFLVGGLAMHLGIYILQKAPFFQFMVLYAVWIPWDRLPPFRRIVHAEPMREVVAG